jgi:succinate dehydrogenase hydrophobic anchor subunit
VTGLRQVVEEINRERARRNARTALWLAALALAFYLGFIALGVLNS